MHSLLTTPDSELSGQNFACISFLEPNKQDVVIERERFMCKNFSLFFLTEVKKVTEYLKTHKYSELNEYMVSFYEPTDKSLGELYDGFLELQSEKLDKEFIAKFNKDQHVTERGVKIRGVFSTQEEANARAKSLSYEDDHVFDIFVCNVGRWLPFYPRSQSISQEYYDNDLNELVNQRVDDKVSRELEFMHRKNKMLKLNDEQKEKDEEKI